MKLAVVWSWTVLVGVLVAVTLLPNAAEANPNMALKKPTWQSTYYSTDAWLNSGLAVDGKKLYKWDEKSCTATKVLKNQWWAVDLGQVSTVQAVRIHGRQLCCAVEQQNMVIGLTNNPPNVVAPTVSNVQICGRAPASIAIGVPYAVVCDVGVPQARYVVLISVTSFLTVCEVEVFGPGPEWSNLALNKPARQSTIQAGGKPEAAVDGSRNAFWNAGSCTATISTDKTPWWAVDLGQPSIIYVVAVTTRADCCASYINTYVVGVTNTDPQLTAPSVKSVKECGRGPAIAVLGKTSAVPCSDTTPPARYVVILRLVALMSMCEVEVYGQATTWTNLALKKYSWQSSLSTGSVPSAAVDGNRDSLWTGGSCTATKGGETGPWWAVDLGQKSDVFVVSVVNRGDCCGGYLANFVAGLTDNPPNTIPPKVSNVYICGRGPSATALSQAYALTCEIGLPPVRYVAIIGASSILTVCEVEVFGRAAVIDPCAVNPCKNGGACDPTGDNGFTCFCKPGWTGSDCSTDVNVCATANPCKNGGTCVKFGNTYECHCSPNWAGTNCEMGSAACKAVPEIQRMNCGWGGVTPAQCNAKSCCYDETYPSRGICYYSSSSCDNIKDEELADCGWDGIDYNLCIGRGCCYMDDENYAGPVCIRKVNPACVGVEADSRVAQGVTGIHPNECISKGWCYDTSLTTDQSLWCFTVKG